MWMKTGSSIDQFLLRRLLIPTWFLECIPQSGVDIGNEYLAGAPMGIPHAVQCGHGDPHAKESGGTTPVRSIGAECHNLDSEP